MPSLSPVHLIIILIIALIVIGPGKLPEVGAALGKSIKEFRKAASDITESTHVDAAPAPVATAATVAPAAVMAAAPAPLVAPAAPLAAAVPLSAAPEAIGAAPAPIVAAPPSIVAPPPAAAMPDSTMAPQAASESTSPQSAS
jgi:TatA/E family protein of Tat protein translocase